MIDVDTHAGLVSDADDGLLVKYRRYYQSANLEVSLPYTGRQLSLRVDSPHLPWHQPEVDEYSYELTDRLVVQKRYYPTGILEEKE